VCTTSDKFRTAVHDLTKLRSAVFIYQINIWLFTLMKYQQSVKYLLRAPASSPLFLTYISICAIFVCQDDFEHAYVCAAVSSLVILNVSFVALCCMCLRSKSCS
jgi:hypothetical protein